MAGTLAPASAQRHRPSRAVTSFVSNDIEHGNRKSALNESITVAPTDPIPNRYGLLLAFSIVGVLSGGVMGLNGHLIRGDDPFFALGSNFLGGYGVEQYTSAWEGALVTPVVSSVASFVLCVAAVAVLLRSRPREEPIEAALGRQHRGLVRQFPYAESNHILDVRPCNIARQDKTANDNSERKTTRQTHPTKQVFPKRDLTNSTLQRVSRRVVNALSTATVIVLLIQLICVSALLGFLDALVRVAEMEKGADLSPGSFARVTLDYQLAAFDRCCFARGHSVQGAVQPCNPAASTPASCAVPDGLIGSVMSATSSSSLCTCYATTQEEFQRLSSYVEDSGLCEQLSNAWVHIGSTERLPRNAMRAWYVFRATRVPVVGPSGDPEYGCGAGMPLGFQWVMYKYLVQTARPFAVGGTVVSVLQLACMLLAVFRCCGLCRDSDAISLGVEFELDDSVDQNELGSHRGDARRGLGGDPYQCDVRSLTCTLTETGGTVVNPKATGERLRSVGPRVDAEQPEQPAGSGRSTPKDDRDSQQTFASTRGPGTTQSSTNGRQLVELIRGNLPPPKVPARKFS